MERIAPTCGCSTTGALARGLCMPCYGRAYRTGTLPPLQESLPFDPPHRLTEVDVIARRAVCSVCGPTDIRLRSGNRGHQCMTRRRSEARGPRRWWTPGPFDHIKAKYGLTRAEWEGMLIAQSGRCGICSVPMQEPAVDHDHDTGAVRDLLCRRCNVALGWLNDDPALVRAAAEYLARHTAPHPDRLAS